VARRFGRQHELGEELKYVIEYAIDKCPDGVAASRCEEKNEPQNEKQRFDLMQNFNFV
jgi:hypothetical protein